MVNNDLYINKQGWWFIMVGELLMVPSNGFEDVQLVYVGPQPIFWYMVLSMVGRELWLVLGTHNAQWSSTIWLATQDVLVPWISTANDMVGFLKQGYPEMIQY